MKRTNTDRARPSRAAPAAAMAILTALAPVCAAAQGPSPIAVATFAGGCFWSMEPPFDRIAGVVETIPGYMGGTTRHPTYEEVASGTTGHAEVVQVRYDPSRVSYEALLEVFWHNVDPTVTDRQFCDFGPQYRTSIFVHDGAQRRAAEASKDALGRTKPFKATVVTPIVAAGEFWPAEESHQDYARKNPLRYAHYRSNCGRDARLAELWGKSAR